MKKDDYVNIYLDSLSRAERAMSDAMPVNGEGLLEEQVRLFAVRERRIMRIIQKHGGDGEGSKISESRLEIIRQLESELTRVQRAKTQCIEVLGKIRAYRGETNSSIDEWIKALVDGGDKK